MELVKILLFLLPHLVNGNTKIHITASTPQTGANIEYLGANVNVIGNEEIYSFGLAGERLKKAVELYSGGHPSSVYVKNPTEYDIEDGIPEELYAKNNFNEVKRRIIPVAGEILNYDVKKVEVSSRGIENNLDQTTKHRIVMAAEVSDSITADWFHEALISKGDDISYIIDIGVDDVINLSFKAPFDDNFRKVINKRIEDEEISIEMEPGKTVEAILTADKVLMVLQVNYTVSLEGDVASYYPESYKGQRLWAYDVNKVLQAAGLPNTFIINEIMIVEYYMNPKTDIFE